jgi:hypothetical protein
MILLSFLQKIDCPKSQDNRGQSRTIDRAGNGRLKTTGGRRPDGLGAPNYSDVTITKLEKPTMATRGRKKPERINSAHRW